MKYTFWSLACICLVLGGCTSPSKQETAKSCCDDKSGMEVVLDLHRKVKPEFVTAFKESFARCKVSTVKEPGCLDYGVYQSPEDSTEFLIYEVWKNEGELAKHGETPHLKQHVEETKAMFDSTSDKKIYVCPAVQP